jgi:hypothetical protein
MGRLSHLLFPWGLLLQGLAIVHFIRRRPDMFWIFIILFLGPLGALVYIFVEALPDLGLLRQSFKVFPRRPASTTHLEVTSSARISPHLHIAVCIKSALLGAIAQCWPHSRPKKC